MPQIKPLNWLLIMTISLTTLVLIIVFIHFSTLPSYNK